ncbi:MAG: hypothetical protein LBR94_01225 [Desulfovibrio sp.]|jgi:hypothetical protein|nr:hypothetical protein [Desulfovibrio sp.]
MPILTPYESRAGIATANAGQAAQYRSGAAFVTPGQSAMPGALDKLAQGMDKLNKAAFGFAMERQKQQNATDMLADKMRLEDEVRAFQRDVQENNKGADARLVDQKAEELFRGQREYLEKRWGGNREMMNQALGMFDGLRQPTLNWTGAWKYREEEAYKAETVEADFLRKLEAVSLPGTTGEQKDAMFLAFERNLREIAGQRQNPETGQYEGGRNVDAVLQRSRMRLDKTYEAEQKRMAAEAKAAEIENLTERFVSMGEEEGGKALLEDEKLKKNPKLLNSVLSGFLYRFELSSRQRAFADKIRLHGPMTALEGVAELPEEQRFQKAQEIMNGLSPKDRVKMERYANAAVGGDFRTDPDAVDSATELLLNGDAVPDDVRMRIAPKEFARLEKKVQSGVLKELRNVFDVTADRWLSEKGNEKHKKEFGLDKATMWKDFLLSTDADEKGDYKRLMQEANDFFKSTALNKVINFWPDPEVSVPSFLVGDYLARNPDSLHAPAQGGNGDYGRIVEDLKAKGIPATDANIAVAYKQIIEKKRKGLK